MMPACISKSARSLTWLLIAAFIFATLPAPVFAQEEALSPEAMGNPEGAPPPEVAAPAPDAAAPAPESAAPDAAASTPEAMGNPTPPPPEEAPAPEAVPAPEAGPAPETAPLTPAETARARIQQLRAARAAAEAEASAGETPAPEGAPTDVAAEESTTVDGEQVYNLSLKDAQLDVLLDRYSELTGRTMIKAPGVAATFTFKAQSKLTRAEMIQAMDSLLSMNNITLVPLGSRFYRVVQTEKAATEGLAIQKETPEGGQPDSDALVSQMVTLKYLEMEDATTIVQAMLHGFGKAQRFDRINSLLVTETSANLKRIYEILEMVDQPTQLEVETRVIPIKYAKASEIAARLNELVTDSQGEKKEEVAQVAQPAALRRAPNMIRARQPVATEPAAAPDTTAAIEAAMAARGIIQGKVKILADERTNILIILSKPSNFIFIDKIVEALDVPVDPEVSVQVIALEFADAEEMAGLLNDFIGAAKSESDTAAPKTEGDEATTDTRAKALEDYVKARAAAADRVRQAAGETAVSKIGQLSPNTKILADKRTNTLLLMGTKGDIAALQEIVKKVDIMLAQVLIEAVILEVNLNNNTAYGVSWLQKSMTAYSQKTAGANGGVSLRDPIASWGGNFGKNSFSTTAGDTITRAMGGGSGLNYFFTFADLNLDMVLDMVASSGEGRVLATPVILTTDNTEATINSGQQIPIRTGDTTSGGTIQSDYEYKDVGIILKVKPRINPSRYVTLEITQTADTLGDSVDVGNNGKMTSINKREMTASISVPSRSTIVLGGLVQTDYQNSNTRVPILGSIPLLGALFRSEDTTRHRTELLVLITPYVLMTPDEARIETERLHHASNVAAEDWYRGWSDSSLAPFSPTKLREMKKAGKLAPGRAQLKTEAGAEPAAPPVALIEPAAPMPKPAPDAQDPEVFAREIEREMSGQAEAAPAAGESEAAVAVAPANPLPVPEESTTTAPYVFDPSVPATPAEPPEPAPPPAPEKKKTRRALWGTQAKKEEAKPSMFSAPMPEAEVNGGTP
jgi:general secretion pathway protein D